MEKGFSNLPDVDPSKDIDPMADEVNPEVTATLLTKIQQCSKYVFDSSDEEWVVEGDNKNIFEILDDEVEKYILVFLRLIKNIPILCCCIDRCKILKFSAEEFSYIVNRKMFILYIRLRLQPFFYLLLYSN